MTLNVTTDVLDEYATRMQQVARVGLVIFGYRLNTWSNDNAALRPQQTAGRPII